MTKKISAMLLSMLMMVVFVPMMSFADVPDTLTGIDFTSISTVSENPVYRWDPNGATGPQLVLRGDIIPGAVDTSSGAQYGIKVPNNTKIFIEGTSKIQALNSSNDNSYGIYAEGNLTICLNENASAGNLQTLSVFGGNAGSGKTSYGIYCASADSDFNVYSGVEGKKVCVNVSSKETSQKIGGIYGFEDMSIKDTILNVDKSEEVATEASSAAGITIDGDLVSTNSEVNVTTNDTTKENVGISTDSVSADASKFDVLTGVVSNENWNVAIYTDGFVKFANSAVSAEAGDISSNAGTHLEGKSAAIFVDTDTGVWTENTVLYTKAGNVENVDNTSSVSILSYDVYMHDTTANAIAGYAKGSASAESAGIYAIGKFYAENSKLDVKAGSSSDATTNNCFGLFTLLGDADFEECEVTASAGKVTEGVSTAVYNAGYVGPEGIKIKDCPVFNLKSGDSDNDSSITLASEYGGIDIEGSSLSAEAGNVKGTSSAISVGWPYYSSYLTGISSDAGLYIKDSTVSAESGTADLSNGYSYTLGVYTGRMYVLNSTLTTLAGKANDSTSIYADTNAGWAPSFGNADKVYKFYIEDSKVTATAGDGIDWSQGIYTQGINIEAKDSKIIATATACNSRSEGLASYIGYTSSGDFYYWGGDIKLTNTDVSASAQGAGQSHAIYAHGVITSTSTNGLTSISAEAGYGSDDSYAIFAEESIDIYKADIKAHAGKSDFVNGGIVAHGVEDLTNAKCIYLHDCLVDVDVDKNDYLVDGSSYGIAAEGMSYSPTSWYYDPDEPVDADVVITDCVTDINVGGYAYEVAGVAAENGKVLVTNPTDSYTLNVKASNGGVKGLYGIKAKSDAEIKGCGAVDVNLYEAAVAGGIASYNKTVMDNANVNVKIDSAGTSRGVYSSSDATLNKTSLKTIIKNVGDEGFGIMSQSDVTVKGKSDILVVAKGEDVWGILAKDVAVNGDSKAKVIAKGTNEGAIAINGLESVDVENADLEMHTDVPGTDLAILAGTTYDFDDAINDGDEVSGGALLTVKNSNVSADSTSFALFSTGDMKVEYDSNIYATSTMAALGDMFIGSEAHPAYYLTTVDVNGEAVYETSGDAIAKGLLYDASSVAVLEPDWANDADFLRIRFIPFDMYKLIFDVNGHGTPIEEKHWVKKGTKLTSYNVTPVKTSADANWTFVGWYRNASCDGAAWNFSYDVMPEAELTLYAKWVKDEPGPGPGPSPSPDPTEPEKPTPVPENIEINVDPIAAGTEITSETVGENIEIKDGDKTLVEGTDYVVYVEKGTKSSIGYKEVSVIGIGSYDGTKTTTYIKVLPKTAKVSSLSKAWRQTTVKWKKVSGVTGYQVRLATSKDFKKGLIKKTIKKPSKTNKTIKNLKSGKKYYVKVRAYKKNVTNPTTGEKETFYGKWSKVQKVKPY